MTSVDTYPLAPEWGSLIAPLKRKMENANGASATPIDQLHQFALKQFQTAQFPGRKHEDWKYTPLRDLLNTNFTEIMSSGNIDGKLTPHLRTLEATRIVFVNGQWQRHLSDPLPTGVWFGTIQDATTNKPVTRFINSLIVHLESTVMSPFEALTSSLTNPGYCLIANPQVRPKQPIHFLHFTEGKVGVPTQYHPYKMIAIGRQANVRIVESFISLNGEAVSLINAVNHILVEDNAQLEHYRMQNENHESFHINMTRVFQEKDSTYTSIAVELGGKMMRNNLEVIHKGTGIMSNLHGVFMGEGHQHLDTQSFIDHAQPHCASNELYKGVLTDHARGVFNGKIIVRADAQKTNAFQQNSTILLSPDAVMDSKPQLEIFADDVKCSHGATIGQLDESALFYLRSRGLNKAEASILLQQAFIGEVLEKSNDDSIKAYLQQKIETRHHA